MKGIIIAAGYGTRFLPCTKTIPKEMFPLIDTPAIDLIVDEFVQSGITEILMVTSRRKKSLEDYFDREIELESVFTREKAYDKLEKIKKDIKIHYVRQQEMLGTGHALLLCKDFVGKDPFIVAYPDDIIFSDIPLALQLVHVFQKTGHSVLAVQEINGDVSRYGVVDYFEKDHVLNVKNIIEKPAPGKEPSKMISIGRYLFTAEIMELLEEGFKNHDQGEFYHIHAINHLADKNRLNACQIDGERLDIGDKLGYFEGIIKYTMLQDDLKQDALKIMQKYVTEK
jgi:UTP--glucose-1-phosphate uridylyltransferase